MFTLPVVLAERPVEASMLDSTLNSMASVSYDQAPVGAIFSNCKVV